MFKRLIGYDVPVDVMLDALMVTMVFAIGISTVYAATYMVCVVYLDMSTHTPVTVQVLFCALVGLILKQANYDTSLALAAGFCIALFPWALLPGPLDQALPSVGFMSVFGFWRLYLVGPAPPRKEKLLGRHERR